MRAINQIIVSTKQVQIDFKTCSIIVIRIVSRSIGKLVRNGKLAAKILRFMRKIR